MFCVIRGIINKTNRNTISVVVPFEVVLKTENRILIYDITGVVPFSEGWTCEHPTYSAPLPNLR